MAIQFFTVWGKILLLGEDLVVVVELKGIVISIANESVVSIITPELLVFAVTCK